LYSAGLTTKALLLISSVVPSGFARATSTVPMLLPAPARFSMTMVCFSSCCSGACSRRASTSDEPAGAKGTMMRIVLAALPCADAAVAESPMHIAAAAASAAYSHLCVMPSSRLHGSSADLTF